MKECSVTTYYLAARYSRRLELCGYRAELQALGIDVPARWLNGSHQLDNEGRPIGEDGEFIFENGSDGSDGAQAVDHWRRKFAQDDYDDVLAADRLIAFTEQPRSGNSRGGRHVELGIALGRGIPAVVIGPRENVFCWLPQVQHYDKWADFITALSLER
jgi:hypothetical protein